MIIMIIIAVVVAAAAVVLPVPSCFYIVLGSRLLSSRRERASERATKSMILYCMRPVGCSRVPGKPIARTYLR